MLCVLTSVDVHETPNRQRFSMHYKKGEFHLRTAKDHVQGSLLAHTTDLSPLPCFRWLGITTGQWSVIVGVIFPNIEMHRLQRLQNADKPDLPSFCLGSTRSDTWTQHCLNWFDIFLCKSEPNLNFVFFIDRQFLSLQSFLLVLGQQEDTPLKKVNSFSNAGKELGRIFGRASEWGL